MNSKNFQLKYIRKQLNVSQKEMGELLGIGQSGYSEIENGRSNLNGPAQFLICRTYNIDPKIFITDLPESEWHTFLNKPQDEVKPVVVTQSKNPEAFNINLLLIEKQRIEKELQAFREENEQLKLFINEHCGK
jgi:transcriptional regulator with XRE-family HTH domain